MNPPLATLVDPSAQKGHNPNPSAHSQETPMLRLPFLALLVILSACSKKEETAAQPAPAQAAPVAETEPLVASVTGEWRSAEDKARDQYRHPQEALTFWGLQPGMTILEVQPGGGWWTEILAPYAYATGGQYYATAADLDN